MCTKDVPSNSLRTHTALLHLQTQLPNHNNGACMVLWRKMQHHIGDPHATEMQQTCHASVLYSKNPAVLAF
jgi:hypothetical protein